MSLVPHITPLEDVIQAILNSLPADESDFCVLPVGGSQLAPFVHNTRQWALLGQPGQDVLIIRGSIRGYQLAMHRPSYVNSLLIASRGYEVRQPCSTCCHARSSVPRPFPICVRVPGHFGGCCANCKWRDWADRCTVRDNIRGVDNRVRLTRTPFESGFILNQGQEVIEGPDTHSSSAVHPTPAGLLLAPLSGSSYENPIDLEGNSFGNPISLDEEDPEEPPIKVDPEGTAEDPVVL